jgi:hypothetical protein
MTAGNWAPVYTGATYSRAVIPAQAGIQFV